MLIAALVALGPVLLLSGVFDLLRRRRFDASATRGTGTVVACERRAGIESDRPVYVLRVVFTAPTGETVEFTDDSTGPRQVGTDIAVNHAPEPPWSARVAEASSGSTMRAYGLMLAGGLVTVALVVVLINGTG